jgi:hypothetical protein
MNIKKIILEEINSFINEYRIWYHGTPDGREINKTKSFEEQVLQIILVIQKNGE